MGEAITSLLKQHSRRGVCLKQNTDWDLEGINTCWSNKGYKPYGEKLWEMESVADSKDFW